MRSFCLAVVLAIGAGSASATTYVLDFTDTQARVIPQSFGDKPEVDLSYRTFNDGGGFGPDQPNFGDLAFFGTGYGDLNGAAWGGTSNRDEGGEIRIQANDPNATVSVESFDLAGWTADEDAEWRFYGLDDVEIPNSAGSGTAPEAGRLSVTPNVSASGGLVFQWGLSVWHVGLENFTFTVGSPTDPVRVTYQNQTPPASAPGVTPLPAAAPLLISGAALLGFLGRRRRG